MLRILFVVIFQLFYTLSLYAQTTEYGYGTVLGGTETNKALSRNFLKDNEKGMQIILINSRGTGIGGGGFAGQQAGVGAGGMGSGGLGNVRLLEVPEDTDYLELLLMYANLDPRMLRTSKIKILRVKSTGESPYLSKEIYRYWTVYNFKKEYERGGPFELLRPGDIVYVQGRGLFNREIFDPLADLSFILSLVAVYFTMDALIRRFR